MSRKLAALMILAAILTSVPFLLHKIQTMETSRMFYPSALAQNLSFSLDPEGVQIWINQDGYIDLLYNITLKMDYGSSDLHWVEIGQPLRDFTIGEAVDQYGNVLQASDSSSGQEYKVRVQLHSTLVAGQTLGFSLLTNVANMIYNDTMNPGNYGMQFVPAWLSVARVPDLRVKIFLPEGVNKTTVKTSVDWDNADFENGRLFVYWERKNLAAGQHPYNFGVSFPKEYLPNYLPNYGDQSGEVTLEPMYDTYVDSTRQNSNYGGQGDLAISTEQIVWLKFNLFVVPNEAMVDRATLQLFAVNASETHSINAYSCSDNSWTELTLTYSNQPSYNTTGMDLVLVPSGGMWFNWTIVDAVWNTLKGSGPRTMTVVLRETSLSASVALFDSKESFYARPPKLFVHWSGIVPEFPSFLILAIFMIATLSATIVYKKN
jgi:hypothetical protein